MSWNWIPQLFYDCIARIIPGCTALCATWLVALGPLGAKRMLQNSRESGYFSFGSIVLLILASYLVGIVLGEVGQRTFKSIPRKCSNKQDGESGKCQDDDAAEAKYCKHCLKVHGELCKSGGRRLTLQGNVLPPTHVMRSHLRYLVPADVARLLKLRAEMRFCEVLILSFTALAIANLWFLFASPGIGRAALGLCFPVAAILLWARRNRIHEHFVTGTCLAWLFQYSAGKLPYCAAPKANPRDTDPEEA